MSISVLSRYLIRTYLEKFLLIFFVISVALLLSNIFDLLNKTRGVSISGGLFIELIFLKLPYLASELLPLNSMLAMFLMNYVLAKRNELGVIWGSGVSVFALVAPIALAAFIVGIFTTTMLNPIATDMLVIYENMEAKLLDRKSPNLTLSNLGIIISENLDGKRRIYVAKSLAVHERKMMHVTILFADSNNNFIERLEADEAILDHGKIELRDVKIFDQHGERIDKETLSIPTTLEIENFVEGITVPDHLSFWKLPEAINNLSDAGLPNIKHKLHYYKILFRPISMVAYLFIAACFMLKDTRQTGTSSLVLGVFIGFAIYLMIQIITNILIYKGVNVVISMALPTLVIILLSSIAILHLRMD
jgi:lipopolysaccharide export system permease protein